VEYNKKKVHFNLIRGLGLERGLSLLLVLSIRRQKINPNKFLFWLCEIGINDYIYGCNNQALIWGYAKK